MNTQLISDISVRCPRAGCRREAFGWDPTALVRAFAGRVFSLARHITQNDEDAENVLVGTFLKVCPDLDGIEEQERVWLKLVTLAVREAFSNLAKRGVGPVPGEIPDWGEDLEASELAVWGDDYPQRHFKKEMTRVLENGLRSLDLMTRTVFVLRDIEQIAVELVARIVNRSVAAVEVCLLRARLELREALAPQMRQAS